MKKISFLVILLGAILLSSCTSTNMKQDVYADFYAEEPVSILIMPVINNSVEVEVKDTFYTYLSKPLCEAGYYVYPPYLTMEILQKESAGDSEMFIEQSVEKFGSYFGADLVLFTRINYCSKMALLGQIVVNVDYILRSTKTDEILYEKTVEVVKDTSIDADSDGSAGLLGFIGSLVATSINTAIEDYESLMSLNCENGLGYLPAGKYSPKYGLDGEEYAGIKEMRISR